MSDYTKVSEALAEGVPPAAICSTCPWDRFCIEPPTMTKDDVSKKMKEMSDVPGPTAEDGTKDDGMPGARRSVARVERAPSRRRHPSADDHLGRQRAGVANMVCHNVI